MWSISVFGHIAKLQSYRQQVLTDHPRVNNYTPHPWLNLRFKCKFHLLFVKIIDIIRQRYACRHHRNCGSRHEQTAATTVYTIPVVRSSPLENSPSIVQPPPQYGQHRCSRPRPEFLNIARQNRDPPPKYEEVMMSRPLSVTPIPT